MTASVIGSVIVKNWPSVFASAGAFASCAGVGPRPIAARPRSVASRIKAQSDLDMTS